MLNLYRTCIKRIGKEVSHFSLFPYMVDTFKAKMDESDTEETELLTVDVSALTFVLVNAVKEMDARLTKLEGKKK